MKTQNRGKQKTKMWEGKKNKKKSILSGKKPREVSHLRASSGVMAEGPRSPGCHVGDVQKLTECERVKCAGKEGNAAGLLPLEGALLEVGLLSDGVSDTGSAPSLPARTERQLRIPGAFLQTWPGRFLCMPWPSHLPPSSDSGKKQKCQNTSKEVIEGGFLAGLKTSTAGNFTRGTLPT